MIEYSLLLWHNAALCHNSVAKLNNFLYFSKLLAKDYFATNSMWPIFISAEISRGNSVDRST